MDEQRYLALANEAFKKIIDSFEDVDAEDADVEWAGDVLTITFRNGTRCVVNTQRPARQIWFAGAKHAWHFSFDDSSGRWMDDKGSGLELFSAVRNVANDLGGLSLRL